MASSKLSALTAITSVGSDDLVYVADTSDGGSSYSSKKVTKANLFSGYATESYVDTSVANLIDSAPGALDTLNELAAALNDDASAAATLTTAINANEAHIDNLATLTGLAKDTTSFGTFTGSTLTDNSTLKSILQDMETAFEEADTNTDTSSPCLVLLRTQPTLAPSVVPQSLIVKQSRVLFRLWKPKLN